MHIRAIPYIEQKKKELSSYNRNLKDKSGNLIQRKIKTSSIFEFRF